jgi:hypothetical protein
VEGSFAPRRLDELSRWIAERHVSGTVTPGFEVLEHKRVQRLELTLTIPAVHGLAAFPGDPDCYRDWQDLRQIVARVLAVDERPCRIDAFDHSFHLRRETGWAPEIQLTAAFDSPPTAPGAEHLLVGGLVEGLRQLGVRT